MKSIKSPNGIITEEIPEVLEQVRELFNFENVSCFLVTLLETNGCNYMVLALQLYFLPYSIMCIF